MTFQSYKTEGEKKEPWADFSLVNLSLSCCVPQAARGFSGRAEEVGYCATLELTRFLYISSSGTAAALGGGMDGQLPWKLYDRQCLHTACALLHIDGVEAVRSGLASQNSCSPILQGDLINATMSSQWVTSWHSDIWSALENRWELFLLAIKRLFRNTCG